MPVLKLQVITTTQYFTNSSIRHWTLEQSKQVWCLDESCLQQDETDLYYSRVKHELIKSCWFGYESLNVKFPGQRLTRPIMSLFQDQSSQPLSLPPADTQQLLVEKIVKLQKACARRQVRAGIVILMGLPFKVSWIRLEVVFQSFLKILGSKNVEASVCNQF